MTDRDSVICSMLRNPLRNYVVPGLTSSLLGGDGHGTVRLFEASREQYSDIVPHSHRFDFTCLVLEGYVVNRVWLPTSSTQADLYEAATLLYGGEPGKYRMKPHALGRSRWHYQDIRYNAGNWYTMDADEIHSITFSRNAVVLFFEGPTRVDSTTIIQPVVDGEVVKTFKVEDWMFQK